MSSRKKPKPAPAAPPPQSLKFKPPTLRLWIIVICLGVLAGVLAGVIAYFLYPAGISVGTFHTPRATIPGGRLQTLEASYDPHKNQWFNVYGNEDRHFGEWGHWTGRGMNWNSMCASCHNTRVRKNYDEKSDSYQTTMAQLTVSCESCHG